MDISKAKKPIHIVCPKCKTDFKYHGASIKSRKEGMLNRVKSLDAKIKREKSKEKRDKLIKQRDDVLGELKVLSEDIHMLSQMSEMEVLKIFKRNTRKYLGDELYIKLVNEAEQQYLDENTFNYYDLAIQRYTNFNNI